MERKTQSLSHISVHQWLRSAIHSYQHLTSPMVSLTSPMVSYLWNFHHCLVWYWLLVLAMVRLVIVSEWILRTCRCIVLDCSSVVKWRLFWSCNTEACHWSSHLILFPAYCQEAALTVAVPASGAPAAEKVGKKAKVKAADMKCSRCGKSPSQACCRYRLPVSSYQIQDCSFFPGNQSQQGQFANLLGQFGLNQFQVRCAGAWYQHHPILHDSILNSKF